MFFVAHRLLVVMFLLMLVVGVVVVVVVCCCASCVALTYGCCFASPAFLHDTQCSEWLETDNNTPFEAISLCS